MNINDEIQTLFSNAVFQNKIENYTGLSNLMAQKIENQYIFGYSKKKYGLPREVESSGDIVYKLVEQIELYIEKYTQIDPSLLDNLFYDLSLSLIFDDYNISNEDHINYKKLISDLKDIGAKSYEGKAVDIGVIFCPDKQSYQQLNQLNIDIISIPSGISIKDFFEKEKPFLRLIDNESFAIIIDGEFNVFAIARKQKSEKSINYIIEKQFSTHVTNKIHNILLDTYLDKLTKNVNKNKAKDLITLKNEMKRNIDNRPQYIYFYLKNWKINIHSKNDFTLTYFNGDWKLKPYNLINAILANYLFKKNIKTLDIDPQVARQIFNDLMDSIEVLSETLKRLSLSNLSSIYLINYEDELLKVINKANKNPSLYI
ncbi:hypothetical protein [Bacillus atrophaeus]|uniref:hypothetical protein n=1 Tax=Bacillus atrophaeus TaxID=1452 RepID=UPI0022827214|nr:hypothetical protein [Bacillus atrophaeus]MCY9204457.1 hypothetical protein [Bacillus atrophaeus]MEC0884870.1 hypothetical protein [Bacillus atrophaeus]